MPRHSAAYEAYLRSPAWARRRGQALRRAGYCCARCGRRHGLQVHHRTYSRLGQELPDDLEVLCKACHAQADTERALETAIRRWRARVDGWARTVYGDAWKTQHQWNLVEQAFIAWLERGEHAS